MSTPCGSVGETILLVEDEQALRSIVLALLSEEGYTVITAVDGMDALEKAEKYDGTIDLLLSDVEMPRMAGVELATQVFLKRPNTKILLMSGLPSGLLVLNEGWQFLPKPFMPEMLRAKIGHILNKTPKFLPCPSNSMVRKFVEPFAGGEQE